MRSPVAFARGLRHPEAFHGHGVRGGFFEGWYVKVVDAGQDARWAFIPGVFRGRDGDAVTDEAFVQVLDGTTGRSWYHRYDTSQFHASDDRFDVRVGPNRFHSRGLSVDLPGIRGEIKYAAPLDGWPVTLRRPGIMGWYAWVPLMECYHGVVSFGHSLLGSLDVDGRAVDFDGGRGYVEKDWGRAFPSGYVWMHSNHIEGHPDASLVASVAIIPWLRSSFRGFIVGLRTAEGLQVWATYNGTRERHLRIARPRCAGRWKARPAYWSSKRNAYAAASCTPRSGRACTSASRRRWTPGSACAGSMPRAGCGSTPWAPPEGSRSTGT